MARAVALGVALLLLSHQPAARTTPQVPRDRPPPARGTAAIHGRVVAAETGQPLRWARVTAQGEAVRLLATTTDADGRYEFAGVPPGRYSLFASKPGYVGLPSGARAYGQRAGAVTVGTAARVATDFALPRGAALEGRVGSPTGDPVQNVTVQALRYVFGSLPPRTVPVGRPARTDDRGLFRVHSLPPGAYFVRVAPLIAPSRGPDDPDLVNRPRQFATTYYPGTARFNDAERVVVSVGETRQVALTLSDVPLASVSFEVTDSQGRRPARAAASLQYAPRGLVVATQGVTVDRPASAFQRVAPGDYRLFVCATTAEGQAEFSYRDVSVSGTDITGVSVRTEPGATVTGRIVVDENAPAVRAEGMAVVAVNTVFPSLAGDPNGAASPARAGAEGRFAFLSLFGPRVFRMPRLSAPWALKAVLLDGRDVADTEVDFRGGTERVELTLVVTNQTGAVSGEVLGAGGREARVVVFAAEEERWIWQSRHIRTVLTEADGSFAIDGLLPGVYFVAAADGLEEGGWNDDRLLRALRETAVRVSVRALSTTTVRLRLEQP